MYNSVGNPDSITWHALWHIGTYRVIPTSYVWQRCRMIYLVFLVEETGISGENRRPAGSYWHTLSHNVVSSTPRLEWNPISPLWIVRVLENNCRMRCQNLIAFFKSCTSSGLSIYLSRGIYFTIGRLYFRTVLTVGYLLFSCY